MHLSFQLYTARDVEPLDPVLDVLKKLGVTHVEGWNASYDASSDLRGALKARQMTMPSAHVSLDRLKDGGFRRQVAQDFGIRLFIVPGISPDRLSHREACLALAAELLELSRDLTTEGLRLGWHNSGAELTPIPSGERPIDILLSKVPNLEWECDLGWLVSAGIDPASELRKSGQRITALHMRDVAGPDGDPAQQGGADIGAGILGWHSIGAALADTRVDLLVMEHDDLGNVSGFINRSVDFLNDWMTNSVVRSSRKERQPNAS